ncbi:nuclear factor 7, ovary-like [Nematolebias whitei]|uniref:nuclear factor 7, ovary-like n=1 Tax=Nematolebias whitei TaxID=451745 RepID=UPI001896AEAA|nr:nuclear factor 7, ovary-like [Nematolebias whitei]
MSVTSYELSEEHLWCCICLDVFTEPVTLPCGHNFCRNCIVQHLKTNSQRQCPMCKEPVDKKQKLGVNTFISELAVQHRQSAGRRSSICSQQHVVTPKPSDGPPVGPKQTSLKPRLLVAFGLTCLILFFGANVRFHQMLSSCNILLGSVEKSSESVCAEHDEPLELYCKNEERLVCQSCRASSHRNHWVVPVGDVYEEKKADLRKMEAGIQQVIWQRRLKIQELRRSVKLIKESADQEMADGIQIFTSLIQNLEGAQTELIEMIEEKQKAAEKQAQSVISELEQEVSQLTRRRVQVEQLSRSKDPVLLLQSLPVLNAGSPYPDRTQVSVCLVAYEGLTRTAMVRAMNHLMETVRDAMKKLQDSEMKNIPQFAVSVTLDPETAHPALVLSDDGKRVHCGDGPKKLPYSSRRFETALHVLGKQGFSCGRFYYDVQVRGKTAWTLGVARESVNKKVDLNLNPETGFWAVRLQNRKEFVALDQSPVPLSVNDDVQKVRVSVDYEEGQVLFYDVDAAVLLHSFTGCSFTEKLYPFFSPGPSDGGRNSAPLIITSLNRRR